MKEFFIKHKKAILIGGGVLVAGVVGFFTWKHLKK
jgi:hypothetical protein